jgi:hypothetical protein
MPNEIETAYQMALHIIVLRDKKIKELEAEIKRLKGSQ